MQYRGYKDVRLGYGIPPSESTVPGMVFAALLERAAGVVIWHWSDLYRDAAWLATAMERELRHTRQEGFTFYWQPRDTGTSIGHTDEYMSRKAPLYRVRVWMDGQSTMMRIEGGPVDAG